MEDGLCYLHEKDFSDLVVYVGLHEVVDVAAYRKNHIPDRIGDDSFVLCCDLVEELRHPAFSSLGWVGLL